MKKYIFLFSLLVIVSVLNAQTDVSGNQSGTWTATNSPYQVTGAIVVPNGQTLNIEPGVEVNFQGHYKFTVNGLLEAVGTQNDSIRFTTNDPATGWGGIRLDGANGTSLLSYCRIEFGKTAGEYPDNHGGGLALIDSDAIVSNCVFADNDATGEDNGMGGAVYAKNTGSATSTETRFTNCRFERNHAYGEGGAIKFTSDMNSEITGCVFIENDCRYGGGAISFYSVVDTKMSQCLFVDNYTLYSNGGAIHTLGFSNTLFFENCTMYGNTANNGDGGAVDLVHTDAEFVNCIIKNNNGAYSDDVYLDMNGAAEINYSNLTMPDGATGSNNIDVDSEFVDVANNDFHLTENSPCIDTGLDIGLAYVGTAPDMGCYEYGSTVGINEYWNDEIKIYPNPIIDLVSFKEIDNLKQVTIVGVSGKLLEKYSIDYLNNTIDLSELITGVYFIRFTTDVGIISKKIIKE